MKRCKKLLVGALAVLAVGVGNAWAVSLSASGTLADGRVGVTYNSGNITVTVGGSDCGTGTNEPCVFASDVSSDIAGGLTIGGTATWGSAPSVSCNATAVDATSTTCSFTGTPTAVGTVTVTPGSAVIANTNFKGDATSGNPASGISSIGGSVTGGTITNPTTSVTVGGTAASGIAWNSGDPAYNGTIILTPANGIGWVATGFSYNELCAIVTNVPSGLGCTHVAVGPSHGMGSVTLTISGTPNANTSTAISIGSVPFLNLQDATTAATVTQSAITVSITGFGGGGVPPTGLPDLTTASACMLILLALSLGLWGYVGRSYVVSRRKS